MPADGSLSERLPTQVEAEKATEAVTILARHRDRRGGLSLGVREGGRSAVVDLPPAIGRLVIDLLQLVGKGEAVTLVPFGGELSTQQAADLLKVSRTFLVQMIENREIPHHKVGTHRRIRMEDLLAYKQRRDRTRNA